MPDIENTDLGWLIQFLGRVNTLGKRGMRAALASQPRCRLGMLEHLHFQIEQSGQDGSIYVSELARAMRQPMPAVSRGLRLLEQDGETAGYGLLSLKYSHEAGGLELWVEELYVRPAFRGRGLGHEFFAWLRGLSAAEHIRRIR